MGTRIGHPCAVLRGRAFGATISALSRSVRGETLGSDRENRGGLCRGGGFVLPPLIARVAELADAVDSKSTDL